MGRKVHPMGFRLGVIRDWQSKWYDDKHYADFILEDVRLRKAIQSKYSDAGISLVEIERQANKVAVTIHTSRPGIVIGRGGQRVEEMRQFLEGVMGGKKIQLDVREVRQPELDAYLVARSVAEQMERRVAYRRAMKQSLFRTIQAGARGMRIICSGRLGGVEIARRQLMHQGRVPLQTLRADVDYGFSEAHTTLGRIGVKVWIYKGDVFKAVEAVEETGAESVVVSETVPVAPEAVRDTTMAEAVARMTDVKPKDEGEAPASEVKKTRVKKKTAEKPAAEIKEEATETSKPKEDKGVEKKAKPRARKSETTAVKTEEKEEEKPVKARASKPKPEAEKESKPKAKKKEE